eukprot:CAMPEP_0171155298 /NCGR_PEP_ID=MMETSP0790-20130122/820_1 /TAXON_ID=2925 /ORGANISM="Alexandrium catenella, Strain OF101" /LENGTH=453 /DNA_ID=CAMNT_0011619497 /DNA_START=32 /DNA_END=1394 /DNA_ORIENTATION=-
MSNSPEERSGRGGPDWTRWAVLLLTCAGLFGQFYAYDNPSALNEQLKVQMINAKAVEESQYSYYFSLLYSVYSFPNIGLPLIMGISVDRCGARVLLCVLAVCVVLGHALFAIGVGMSSWKLMIIGRVVFGIGGESIQVAQNCLLFRWFKGAEVAFALGLNLSVARAGSVLNDVLSPWAAQHWGVAGAMWLGFLLCIGSCLANFSCAAIDKWEGARRHLPEAGEEKVYASDILRMNRSFWLLVGLCVTMYCSILPFNNVASAFFVETWYSHLPLAEAQQRAGNVMSLIFLVSAFGTPPFGGLVDFIGFLADTLLDAQLGAVVVTYAFIFAMPPPVSTLCLGIVYTVFAGALWPAFTLAVPQAQLGTAYGVATALQNAGLAVVPLFIGHLQAAAGAGHYMGVMHTFLVFGIVGTVVAALLWQSNYASAGPLNLPSAEAEKEAHKVNEKTPLTGIK